MSSSSDYSFVKAKTQWVNRIKYKPLVVDKRGGKSLKMTVDGQWLTLQVPLMFTWGASEYVDESTGIPKYSLGLVFDPEKSDAQAKFLEQMKLLQDKIYEDAVTNSKDWFGKSKMSKEVAEAMSYPLLKYPKNKETGEPDYDRNPTMTVKMPYWEGKFNLELFDMKGVCTFKQGGENNRGTPMTLIPKGSYVKGLVQCKGLWFVGGKFGVTWQLLQACVKSPVRLLGQGVCRMMEDSDDDEIEAAIDQEAEEEDEEEVVENNGPSFEVESNDDEEDEEEEEQEDEVVEVVVPKKKKKVVRRKKTTTKA